MDKYASFLLIACLTDTADASDLKNG